MSAPIIPTWPPKQYFFPKLAWFSFAEHICWITPVTKKTHFMKIIPLHTKTDISRVKIINIIKGVKKWICIFGWTVCLNIRHKAQLQTLTIRDPLLSFAVWSFWAVFTICSFFGREYKQHDGLQKYMHLCNTRTYNCLFIKRLKYAKEIFTFYIYTCYCKSLVCFESVM